MFTRLLRALDTGLGHLSALLGVSALLLSFFAFVTRYFLPAYALNWSSEVIVFATMWTVFLGAGRLAFRDAHIGTDSFLNAVTPEIRRAAVMLATALGIALAILMVWSGTIVVAESIRWDERTASTLRLPLWTYYLSLPTGFACVGLFLLGRLLGAEPSRDDRSGHSDAGVMGE